MIIEKRGLINIEKSYCKLIEFLDTEEIVYYETNSYDEIIIDLDEYDSFEQEIILSKLYINRFISHSEKLSIIQNSLNKLVFWR